MWVAVAVWHVANCYTPFTFTLLCRCHRGALGDNAICQSVPAWAIACWLPAAGWPPEMCGLRTRSRMDVDPLLSRTAIGGRHIVSPPTGRQFALINKRATYTEPFNVRVDESEGAPHVGDVRINVVEQFAVWYVDQLVDGHRDVTIAATEPRRSIIPLISSHITFHKISTLYRIVGWD